MTKSEKFLGFNPISKKYTCFMVVITPEMAQYILDNHNYDNRKISQAQKAAINKSIQKGGWQQDGGACAFNTEGDLTEFQHRLLVIVENNLTVTVPVVVGVPTDSFTKTAAAKPRKPVDEIQRKDSTATSDEVTTLSQILTRRKGEKLSMQNAINSWTEWKNIVREGEKLTKTFFEDTDKWNPWRRNFSAWASLMISIDKKDAARNFLSILKNETLETKSTILSKQFGQFFQDENTFLSNTDRVHLLWFMLCTAADRIIKKPNGDIEFNLTQGKCNHTSMVRTGCYRQFLYDPDNVQPTDMTIYLDAAA